MTGRKLLRGSLLLLCVGSVWTAYTNVLEDDTEVRAKALAALSEAAGCAGDCRLEGLRGDRGMLSTEIAYDVRGKGRYVVVCRRPFVAAGEHECTVTERPSGGAPSASP